jgi:hypothetical protein
MSSNEGTMQTRLGNERTHGIDINWKVGCAIKESTGPLYTPFFIGDEKREINSRRERRKTQNKGRRDFPSALFLRRPLHSVLSLE